MKNLWYLSLLPSAAFCAHSHDVGAFTSIQNEAGYTYEVVGVSLSYSIYGEKGLGSENKIFYSYDDGCYFVRSQSEVYYDIPFNQITFSPFVGSHTFFHRVFTSDDGFGVVTRQFSPIGAKFSHTFQDWSLTWKLAHLFPIWETYHQNSGNEHVGYSTKLKGRYHAFAEISYGMSDIYKAYFSFQGSQPYSFKSITLLGEVGIRFNF